MFTAPRCVYEYRKQCGQNSEELNKYNINKKNEPV